MQLQQTKHPVAAFSSRQAAVLRKLQLCSATAPALQRLIGMKAQGCSGWLTYSTPGRQAEGDKDRHTSTVRPA